MITINGEVLNCNSLRLADYLSENNYNISRIAIELNGEILKKECYASAVLKNGDKAEIVTFVGGG